MEEIAKKSGRHTKSEKTPFTGIFRELVGTATQQEIADKIGVSRQNVGKWLSGMTSPDITALRKIANAYNVSTDYLLGLTQTKTTDINLKSVCDYTGLSEKAVKTILRISKCKDLLSVKTLNLVLSSDQFLFFMYCIRDWLNQFDLLQSAINDFKERLVELGEEPPKDIMKYIAEISLDSGSCLYRNACDVMQEDDNLNYCEYKLQRQLNKNLESFKTEKN